MSFHAFDSEVPLESEVFADARDREKLAQRPTDPEVLFDTHSLQTHRFIHLPKSE